MLHEDLVRVRHAIDAAVKAIEISSDKTKQDFIKEEILTLATTRLLEIIGEAANGISLDFRLKHENIPWQKMISLRNRLIHGYYDINLEII